MGEAPTGPAHGQERGAGRAGAKSRSVHVRSGVAAATAALLVSLAGAAAAATPSPRILSASQAPSGALPASPPVQHACGVPAAREAQCGAIELLEPAIYWHPGPAAHGPGGGGGGGSTVPQPPGSGYYPADLQSAYDLERAAASFGPGPNAPTVAVVDAYDDPNAASDLAAYRSSLSGAADPATGLADGTIPPLCGSGTTSGCVTFTKVNQSGGTSYPRGNTGWAEEISLDLDMISAICPSCNIVLVEASSSSMSNLAAAVAYAKTLHPAAVTNSYGGGEFSSETSYDGTYSATSATAITAASGDGGYGVEYPAASPGVTAVGGTSLTYSGTGTSLAWNPQVVWSGSGSGCSSYEPIPSWQDDQGVYSLSADCAGREVADVSAVADPSTGVAVYDTYKEPGWLVFGGTSVSTQIVGATYALAAGSGSVEALPSALYPDTGGGSGPTPGLAPVASGSNGSCGDYLCDAADSLTSGYNGPAGLGTPEGIAAFSSKTATTGALSFSATDESLVAGTVSGPISVDLSSATSSAVSVTLTTSSSGGGFSTSSDGPFAASLSISVPAGAQTSSFYYEDTKAGTSTVAASATGWSSGSMTVTVSPAALATITVSPSTATVAEGGTQGFSATGYDAYGNVVSIDPSWSTDVSGSSLSPTSGASTTFTAGTSTGSGSVSATVSGGTSSISGSASVTITSLATMTVRVGAGSTTKKGPNFHVPLTVTATDATSGAPLGGAAVSLDVFAGTTCSGTPASSATATTGSSGQASFTFSTRQSGEWCALATVDDTGYLQGSGETTFTT